MVTFRTELHLTCDGDVCNKSDWPLTTAAFDNLDVTGPPTLKKLMIAAERAGWKIEPIPGSNSHCLCPGCAKKES